MKWKPPQINSPYKAFAHLWVFAHIVHIAHEDFFPSWEYALLFVAAIAYMAIPMRQLFVTVLLLQLLTWWLDLPTMDNHWFLVAMVNGTIFIVMIPEIVRPRMRIDAAYERLLPVLRNMILLFYASVTFHKFNADFFDPSVSCVLGFYHRIASASYMFPLPELSGIWASASTYVIFLFFLGSALSFSWRRTWFLGICFGLLFHLPTTVLMLHFSMIMFALYFLYLPLTLQRKMLHDFEALLHRVARRSSLYFLFLALMVIWATAGTERWYLESQNIGSGMNLALLFLRVWDIVLLSSAIFFVIYMLRKKRWKTYEKHPRRLLQRWHIVFPLVFILNSLCPYLGLKTRMTMSMWSNIQMENGQSNHLLLPAMPHKLFGYQEDVIEINDSSDPFLRSHRDNHVLLTWVSFHRHVYHRIEEGDKNIRLLYKRNGRLYDIKNAENDEQFLTPEPWWSAKFLDFRPFRDSQKAPCIW